MNVVGERIVVFGDSLSHPGADNGPSIVPITPPFGPSSAPGELIGRQFLSDGAQAVRINARVGRSARSFVGNEDSGTLLASDRAFQPTKVVVMLGTNDIDQGLDPAALATTKNAMTQIRDAYRAMNAEVFAIGPPSYLNDHYTQGAPVMLTLMRDVFGADHTLDAQPLTVGAARTNDGVHFVESGAVQVGPTLARAIEAVGTPSSISETGFSTGTKVALGLLGVAVFVGLGWLALRTARRIAERRSGKRQRNLSASHRTPEEAKQEIFQLMREGSTADREVALDLALEYGLVKAGIVDGVYDLREYPGTTEVVIDGKPFYTTDSQALLYPIGSQILYTSRIDDTIKLKHGRPGAPGERLLAHAHPAIIMMPGRTGALPSGLLKRWINAWWPHDGSKQLALRRIRATVR